MNKKDKILLLGSNGMIGSSIFKNLQLNGFENILALVEMNLILPIKVTSINILKIIVLRML